MQLETGSTTVVRSRRWTALILAIQPALPSLIDHQRIYVEMLQNPFDKYVIDTHGQLSIFDYPFPF
jgi:hypothetical protein